MESENVHHQYQLQDQFVGSSSSLHIPHCYGVASTNSLNSNDLNPNYNGAILQSRQKNEINLASSPQHSCMIQDWTSNITGGESFHDLSDKLLVKTISCGFPMFSSDFYSTTHSCSIPPESRGNFSQIYPSINISNSPNINPSSSFDMNLEALDLLTPARFSRNRSFSQYPSSQESPFLGLHHHHHFQQSNQRPAYNNPSKISPFPTEITEAKRPSILAEPKAITSGAAAKKSRLESRASCPPFKVRKEKLGDRIAALHQLVAPFGKTDTASVLMEANGYIKFLQNQVETLSVPYMKSSRTIKTSRSKQGGSEMEENEEPTRDLRTRGLCLVPLSCMSYVTTDTGGGIWPPPQL